MGAITDWLIQNISTYLKIMYSIAIPTILYGIEYIIPIGLVSSLNGLLLNILHNLKEGFLILLNRSADLKIICLISIPIVIYCIGETILILSGSSWGSFLLDILYDIKEKFLDFRDYLHTKNPKANKIKEYQTVCNNEITIYMKVYGLAVDENGNKDYEGLKLNVGYFNQGNEIPYDELISIINKEELIKIMCFNEMKILYYDEIINPEDIIFITKEDYERDYGDEDEE